MDPVQTGSSNDNTTHLSAIAWRHVQFIEEVGRGRPAIPLLIEQWNGWPSSSDLFDELHVSPGNSTQVRRVIVAGPRLDRVHLWKFIPLLTDYLAAFSANST